MNTNDISLHNICTINMNIIYLMAVQWRIKWGGDRDAPYLSVQILSYPWSFWQNVAKYPPWGWRPPLLGNPGYATAVCFLFRVSAEVGHFNRQYLCDLHGTISLFASDTGQCKLCSFSDVFDSIISPEESILFN